MNIMTRQNILLEITAKNNGILGQVALDMIEVNFKRHDASLVSWKREGQRIRVLSTYSEIMKAVDPERLTGYQKSVIQYKKIPK